MDDQAKTKQQLIDELAAARGRCAELEGKVEALQEMREALRTSEERLELALSGAEIGLWDYNLQTGEGFISPQRAAIVGYSVEELEPHFSSWSKLVHPEDIARVTDAFNAHVQGRTPFYECEHRLRTKTGDYIWILARAKIVEWDKDGSPLRIAGTSLDITDRKRAEEGLQKAHDELERRVADRTVELVRSNQLLEREIAEREKTEQALRENEKRYRQLVDKANDIIYLTDADGYLVLINAVGLNTIGCSQDEVVHKHYLDLIHPDYKKQAEKFYGRQFVKRIPDTYYEVPIVSCHGETVWIGQNVQLVMEGEDVIGFQAVCRDISARKRAEEALKDSEQMLKSLLAASPVGILFTRNSKIKWANDAWVSMFGFQNECEYLDQPTSMMHSSQEEYERTRKVLYQGLSSGRVSETDAKLRKTDGSSLDAHIRANYLDPSDPGKGTISAISDISDRKRAEEELRESEERLELALEGADLGLWDWNLKTGRAVWNDRATEMLGYLPGEVETNIRTWKNGVHPEDWPHVSEVLNHHLKGLTPFFELEYRMRCKSGEWKWILGRGKIMEYDEEGKPSRFSGTSFDVTERKKMEAALRENEEMYRAIFNNAAVGINLSDRETRYLQVNARSASMLGYTQEELQSLTAFDITLPDDREASLASFAALVDGKVDSYTLEKRYVRKDGEVVWAEAYVSAIHNERGEFLANLGVIVDISDRKRAEREGERMRAQLLHARKMEAIGTLTGGIAHEFNNLLTIVSGYAELLLAEQKEKDPGFSDLQRIVQAAQRGAELVRSLLAYSRRSEMTAAPLNLNHEVQQVKKLLDRTLPKMIEIEVNLADGLKTVEADSGQIRQILMNLALNARDAMPDGGKLNIKTANVDEERVPLPLGAEQRDYVELTVSDTGVGMDRDTLDRIFEPFYTTKGLAYKTGLGLAVVHGIIEQHGGCVLCDSNPGQGTTFKIYFPAAEARKPLGAAVPTQPLGGTETILLVDDEEYVRDLASRFLEYAGYRVIAAEDARMALELYVKESSNISLVILDLIMPKMGGRQCLEELLKIEPRLKVLIASGYSDADSKEELVRAGARGFVEKPFQITELLKAIRDVLDTDNT